MSSQEKGGKKGSKLAAPAAWDWGAMRTKVARPVELCMDLDLAALYRGRPVEDDLLNLFVR